MKAIVGKLAIAAAVTALLPAAARACEPAPRAAFRAAVVPPAIVVQPAVRFAVPPPPAVALRVNAGFYPERHEHGWYAWRARERAELRSEYARLDGVRARFYAVPHRPGRVRQFEAWYAHEHAELDARWARVS
jgi:hypothetical protein